VKSISSGIERGYSYV